MNLRNIYVHGRPATGAGLENETATVSAALDRDDDGQSWVSIQFARSDFAAKGIQPVHITLTLDEFRAIGDQISKDGEPIWPERDWKPLSQQEIDALDGDESDTEILARANYDGGPA